MPTKPYKNKEGKRVPSVTGILSRFKESRALMIWANELGLSGVRLNEYTSAADAGTLAHAMIESLVRSTPFPHQEQYDPEIYGKALNACQQFQKWQSTTRFQMKEAELDFVCECHQLGGTMDLTMTHGGDLTLADIKTSSDTYVDYMLQLAAYGHLLRVHRPELRLAGYYILRVSREEADFHTDFWSQLDDAWEMFQLLRQAWDLDKKLKARK